MNVPDDRYKWLVDLYKPKSAVPAFLEVVDIAGLVKCVSASGDCTLSELELTRTELLNLPVDYSNYLDRCVLDRFGGCGCGLPLRLLNHSLTPHNLISFP